MSLDECMSNMIEVFKKYASGEGDARTMSKAEAKKLIQEQMQETLGNVADQGKVDEIFQGLDQDYDGKVDFVEFSIMIIDIAGKVNLSKLLEEQADSTSLEGCAISLAKIFNEYASGDDDAKTMSKAEVKKLIQEQILMTPDNVADQEKVDEIFLDLDLNCDGKMNFMEFSIMIIDIAGMVNLSRLLQEQADSTSLEGCMISMAKIFNEYASGDGDARIIRKAEAKKLIQEQILMTPDWATDQGTVDEIFQGLDLDCDGKMDFVEFSTLIVRFAVDCKLYGL